MSAKTSIVPLSTFYLNEAPIIRAEDRVSPFLGGMSGIVSAFLSFMALSPNLDFKETQEVFRRNFSERRY